jgi:hypothetical protein
MSDENQLMAREDDHNTTVTSSQPHPAPSYRRLAHVLIHRWPTALGVMVAALTAFDLNLNAESVAFLSALLIFMALIYVGAAALNQRRAAWVVFLVGFVIVGLLRLFTAGIVPAVVMLVAALGFLALGVVRGHLRRSDSFPLQAAGMLIFGAVALVALSLEPPIGGYLVAVALLGHGLWDTIHLWRNRVVARSYAEFCAVVGLLLGVVIIIFA